MPVTVNLTYPSYTNFMPEPATTDGAGYSAEDYTAASMTSGFTCCLESDM